MSDFDTQTPPVVAKIEVLLKFLLIGGRLEADDNVARFAMSKQAQAKNLYAREPASVDSWDSNTLMSSPQKYETDEPAKKEFWKSLLRIQADVAVVLAQQPIAVERVLHFVPGMMLQFEKQCDSPLALEVKGQKVAEGEVVKVGDKFGLRITDVCEHSETWVPLITQTTADAKPTPS